MCPDDENANKINKIEMKENINTTELLDTDWAVQEVEKEQVGGRIKGKLEL